MVRNYLNSGNSVNTFLPRLRPFNLPECFSSELFAKSTPCWFGALPLYGLAFFHCKSDIISRPAAALITNLHRPVVNCMTPVGASVFAVIFV